MSYSRWIFSSWYSFWNASSGDKKEDQVLSLWLDIGHTKDWTYSELVNMSVTDIQKHYECDLNDAEEAMMYIKEFIQDVNDYFNRKEIQQ